MLSRSMTARTADLTLLVQQLQHLKQEHRELLAVIAADPAMAPATRSALLDHLLQEEDELVARIAAAAGGSTSSPRPAALTVGSLRAIDPGDKRR
jgi:hypothetical protein